MKKLFVFTFVLFSLVVSSFASVTYDISVINEAEFIVFNCGIKTNFELFPSQKSLWNSVKNRLDEVRIYRIKEVKKNREKTSLIFSDDVFKVQPGYAELVDLEQAIKTERKLLKKLSKYWQASFKFYNYGKIDVADKNYRRAYQLIQELRTAIYENGYLLRPARERNVYMYIVVKLDLIDYLSSFSIAYRSQSAILSAIDNIEGQYNLLNSFI